MNKPSGDMSYDELRGAIAATASRIVRPPAADRRVRARTSDRHGARHRGGSGGTLRRAAVGDRAFRACAGLSAASPRCSRCFAHASSPASRRATRTASPGMKNEEKSVLRPQAAGGALALRVGSAVVAGDAQSIRACRASSTPPSPSSPKRATSICSDSAARSRSPRIWPMCCASSAGASCCSTASAAAFSEQSHAATSEDAVVAISFRNYYPDTARLFPELVARRRSGDLDHRQPAEPDRRGRQRRVRNSRTCPSRRCARW